MAGAFDPAAVKSLTQDFGWINKGIESAEEYAVKRSEVDLRREQLQQRQEEIDLQKRVLKGEVGKMALGTLDAIALAPPKSRERKALIAQLQRKLSVVGEELNPGLMANLEEMEQNDVVMQAIDKFKTLSPEQAFEAGAYVPEFLASESYRNMAESFISAKAKQAELDARAKEADRKEASDARAVARDDFKNIRDLRKEAQAIEKQYDALNQVDVIANALNQNTRAGDTTAIQQFLKLVGDSRVAVAEIKSMSNTGDLFDNLEGTLQATLEGKGTLGPAARANLKRATLEITKLKEAAKKNSLSPIYEMSKDQFGKALQAGQILNKKSLQLMQSEIVADNSTDPQKFNERYPASDQRTKLVAALKDALSKGAKRSDIEARYKAKGKLIPADIWAEVMKQSSVAGRE